MKVERIPLLAQPVMPWANGGGSTRQVAIDPPEGSLAGGFRWRISIAQVASDGPFSRLPGIVRSSWLLAGAGVRLDVDGRQVVLDRPLQRFDFAGDTPIACTLLAGPCEDLNLMTTSALARADAEVHELRAGAALAVGEAEQHLLLALRGGFEVPEPRLAVQEREAVRASGEAGLRVVAAGGSCAVLVARFWARR